MYARENNSPHKQIRLFYLTKMWLSFCQRSSKITKDCPPKEIKWWARLHSQQKSFCSPWKCFLCTALICQILKQSKLSIVTVTLLSWLQCRVYSTTVSKRATDVRNHRAHVVTRRSVIQRQSSIIVALECKVWLWFGCRKEYIPSLSSFIWKGTMYINQYCLAGRLQSLEQGCKL